jgi:peptidoglycan/LPS O-acetylase OafA/YrhL
VAWFARGRLRPKTTAWVLLGLTAATCVASLVHRVSAPTSGTGVAQFLPSVNGFCPGIALAVVEVMWVTRVQEGPWARRAPIGLIAGSFSAFLALILIDDPTGHRYDALMILGCGLLVAAALLRQWSGAGPWRLLDAKPLHWVGERSYSVYLLHVIAITKLVSTLKLADDVPIGVEWAIIAVLALVLTLAASAITYRFVERPFLDRRLPWRADPAADAAAHSETAGIVGEPVAAQTATPA